MDVVEKERCRPCMHSKMNLLSRPLTSICCDRAARDGGDRRESLFWKDFEISIAESSSPYNMRQKLCDDECRSVGLQNSKSKGFCDLHGKSKHAVLQSASTENGSLQCAVM